jgi:hypothetical protein
MVPATRAIQQSILPANVPGTFYRIIAKPKKTAISTKRSLEVAFLVVALARSQCFDWDYRNPTREF